MYTPKTTRHVFVAYLTLVIADVPRRARGATRWQDCVPSRDEVHRDDKRRGQAPHRRRARQLLRRDRTAQDNVWKGMTYMAIRLLVIH